MKKPAMIVTLVGALVLGLYVTAGGQAGGGAAPTKVAVVNLQEIINNADQQASNRAANQKRGEDLQAEQKTRQDAIVALQNQIDPLEPGSEAWQAKRDEIQQKTLELRVWAELQEQRTQQTQALQLIDLYEAVLKASESVAVEMGYDIVIQEIGAPNLRQATNAQQLLSFVQSTKVLYASDGADITDEVLARVNAEYK